MVKHSTAGEGQLTHLVKKSFRKQKLLSNLDFVNGTSQETTCLDTGAGGTFSAGVADE